jgi:tRNA 2-thiouridine synthesizing protein A
MSPPGRQPSDRPAQQPVVIDGGDRSCVGLLLELRTHIAGLPAGTLIHLIATDPAAPIDLPAWCHLTGHAYLGLLPRTRTPIYAMRTAARPALTDPDSPWRRRT